MCLSFPTLYLSGMFISTSLFLKEILPSPTHEFLSQYWGSCFLFFHFHVNCNTVMVSIFREQFSELLFRFESSVNKDAFSLPSSIFSSTRLCSFSNSISVNFPQILIILNLDYTKTFYYVLWYHCTTTTALY